MSSGEIFATVDSDSGGLWRREVEVARRGGWKPRESRSGRCIFRREWAERGVPQPTWLRIPLRGARGRWESLIGGRAEQRQHIVRSRP
jgi:hypothetical protein